MKSKHFAIYVVDVKIKIYKFRGNNYRPWNSRLTKTNNYIGAIFKVVIYIKHFYCIFESHSFQSVFFIVQIQ